MLGRVHSLSSGSNRQGDTAEAQCHQCIPVHPGTALLQGPRSLFHDVQAENEGRLLTHACQVEGDVGHTIGVCCLLWITSCGSDSQVRGCLGTFSWRGMESIQGVRSEEVANVRSVIAHPALADQAGPSQCVHPCFRTGE